MLDRLEALNLAVPKIGGGGGTDVLPANPRLITFGDVTYSTSHRPATTTTKLQLLGSG